MTLERTSTAACRPRPPEQSPDVLIERAQLAENAGDIAGAERLYRVLMNCDPTDAAAPFNPANLFWATTARLKPKRRCVRPRALIRRSRKLGTIFPTCWTRKVAQKPQSIVCGARSRLPRTTPARCLILRFCYSEVVGTRKRRSTGGGNILPMMSAC